MLQSLDKTIMGVTRLFASHFDSNHTLKYFKLKIVGLKINHDFKQAINYEHSLSGFNLVIFWGKHLSHSLGTTTMVCVKYV